MDILIDMNDEINGRINIILSFKILLKLFQR
jgi:hypothetical protein